MVRIRIIKRTIIIPIKIFLFFDCAIFLEITLIAKTNNNTSPIETSISIPPTLQASLTGFTETSTAAKPPNAVKPITPKFISPAYPH